MGKLKHWSKWSILKDGNRVRIRRYRYVNDLVVWESYPNKKYEGYSEDELRTLVNRLNATRLIEERSAEARYDFDYSYINKHSLEKFEDSLRNRINAKDYIVNIMNMLYDFPLNFFINIIKVPDPNHWLRYENQFSSFLLKDKKSASYLRRIVQVTNRFLKFLHRSNPNEIQLVVLDPLSKIKLQSIQVGNLDTRQKYITKEQYDIIISKVDPIIKPAIQISYNFGLRIAEVLGLETDDIFEECLDVNRQLIKLNPIKYTGPLKNKTKRSVEYWFATPDEIFEWISNLPLIHHDTLSDKFRAEMKRLKLPFQFHDLRRTFITNALRIYNHRDVQLAAGHSDLRTTMRYAQDDRQLQRKKFKPKSKIKIVKE